jgi:hypothetical protein
VIDRSMPIFLLGAEDTRDILLSVILERALPQILWVWLHV